MKILVTGIIAIGFALSIHPIRPVPKSTPPQCNPCTWCYCGCGRATNICNDCPAGGGWWPPYRSEKCKRIK